MPPARTNSSHGKHIGSKPSSKAPQPSTPSPWGGLDKVKALFPLSILPPSPADTIHYFSCVDIRDYYAAAEYLQSLPHRTRVEYHTRSKQHVLQLMVPSLAHERFASFIFTLRDRLFTSGFYSPSWTSADCISLSGSAPLTINYRDFRTCVYSPDGSLTLPGSSTPFLVLEVANTQTTMAAKAKVRPYLFGTNKAVRFVLILDLFDRIKYRGRGADGPGFLFATVSLYTTRQTADGRVAKVALLEDEPFWTRRPPEEKTLEFNWDDMRHNNPQVVGGTARIPLGVLWEFMSDVQRDLVVGTEVGVGGDLDGSEVGSSEVEVLSEVEG